MEPPTIRIALADDDVLLREGLARLLEGPGSTSSARRATRPSCSSSSARTTPDVVIVDIRMPPTHETEGLEAARVIREEFPEVGILVLSAHVEVEEAMGLLAGGRRGSATS